MKKMELLAPAGGKTQFIAAVENGADAVYIGGKNFSARNNAQNFSDEEAEEAIDYGHLRDVKTYVAMNTLMEDGDLHEAYRQAARYFEMGADALIIQDLGLGRILRRYLPEMPLHLSTQAGVCDAAGVRAAAELGYERAVLAREATLEEIKKAAAQNIEIEVFVHGALCICYSGQCQLSRSIGGRSGNKGTCAQPCRLPYKGADGKYPLSPKDLCLIEDIGELAAAGVASLKIEGRMKSPEYVAVVTSIYRKYIDLHLAGKDCSVSGEDMERLKQIFNRGGFTRGYFYGDPERDLMHPEFSKNGGVYAGRIAEDSSGPLVKIRRERDSDDGLSEAVQIEKGDYIEIRSKNLVSNLVTYCQQEKGATIVGDIKERVFKGDRVFRLTSASQMKNAAATFENLSFNEGKFSRKTPVTMILKLLAEREMSLSVSALGHRITVSSDVIPERAKNGVGFADSAEAQLSKTGGTAFSAGEIRIHEPQPAYVPVSAVNRLRREALTMLENEIIAESKAKAAPESQMETAMRSDEDILEIYMARGEFDEGLLKKALSVRDKVRFVVPVRDYGDFKRKMEKAGEKAEIRPYIMPMEKMDAARVAEIERELGDLDCPIYVNNLSQIMAFRETEHKMYGDYGLNVTNGESEAAYKDLGVEAVIGSLEEADGRQGNYPLMISEHRFESQRLVDRKGEEYEILFYDDSHKTVIRRKKPSVKWENIAEKGRSRLYF